MYSRVLQYLDQPELQEHQEVQDNVSERAAEEEKKEEEKKDNKNPPKKPRKPPQPRYKLKYEHLKDKRSGLRYFHDNTKRMKKLIEKPDTKESELLNNFMYIYKEWYHKIAPKLEFNYFVYKCQDIGREPTLRGFLQTMRQCHKGTSNWEDYDQEEAQNEPPQNQLQEILPQQPQSQGFRPGQQRQQQPLANRPQIGNLLNLSMQTTEKQSTVLNWLNYPIRQNNNNTNSSNFQQRNQPQASQSSAASTQMLNPSPPDGLDYDVIGKYSKSKQSTNNKNTNDNKPNLQRSSSGSRTPIFEKNPSLKTTAAKTNIVEEDYEIAETQPFNGEIIEEGPMNEYADDKEFYDNMDTYPVDNELDRLMAEHERIEQSNSKVENDDFEVSRKGKMRK